MLKKFWKFHERFLIFFCYVFFKIFEILFQLICVRICKFYVLNLQYLMIQKHSWHNFFFQYYYDLWKIWGRPVARGGGGWGGFSPPPQSLADQFTLSRPGWAHYPHPLLLAPPDLQTLRRPCGAFDFIKNNFGLYDTFKNSKRGCLIEPVSLVG